MKNILTLSIRMLKIANALKLMQFYQIIWYERHIRVFKKVGLNEDLPNMAYRNELGWPVYEKLSQNQIDYLRFHGKSAQRLPTHDVSCN